MSHRAGDPLPLAASAITVKAEQPITFQDANGVYQTSVRPDLTWYGGVYFDVIVNGAHVKTVYLDADIIPMGGAIVSMLTWLDGHAA